MQIFQYSLWLLLGALCVLPLHLAMPQPQGSTDESSSSPDLNTASTLSENASSAGQDGNSDTTGAEVSEEFGSGLSDASPELPGKLNTSPSDVSDYPKPEEDLDNRAPEDLKSSSPKLSEESVALTPEESGASSSEESSVSLPEGFSSSFTGASGTDASEDASPSSSRPDASDSVSSPSSSPQSVASEDAVKFSAEDAISSKSETSAGASSSENDYDDYDGDTSQLFSPTIEQAVASGANKSAEPSSTVGMNESGDDKPSEPLAPSTSSEEKATELIITTPLDQAPSSADNHGEHEAPETDMTEVSHHDHSTHSKEQHEATAPEDVKTSPEVGILASSSSTTEKPSTTTSHQRQHQHHPTSKPPVVAARPSTKREKVGSGAASFSQGMLFMTAVLSMAVTIMGQHGV